MSSLHVITGGAGFVATNLARALLERGSRLVLIDNLSRGKRSYVDALGHSNRISFIEADVSHEGELEAALSSVSAEPDAEIWHLCANSDIPAGVNDPTVDLRDTFMVTFALLQLMRRNGWKRLHFSSTSAVYGDHGSAPLTEETFVEPISNYGAMKLASEAAIRAWCESSGGRASVFRFPNVVGVPATHGVLIDFVRKLQADSSVLPVLGDGTQRKAYLHVSDLVEAMLFIRQRDLAGYQLFNIGPRDEGITVREIAELVCQRVAPEARLSFGAEGRGWVGDVPRFRYDVSKLAKLGWSSAQSSLETIRMAIDQIAMQEGVGAP
ncbi:NAD-dependent epimerase/dehydratase family protein [Bosea sp. ASV33]|uniref:NAD-dependent epimerase/dehydratase family protein n=1 Tax=Bosea sp. ASV33 TaxID=2795106 RepID=UPI0018EC12AA|nr:NAD-dependent epimerase/dehydratase family protein [Bosea sp. ASV33]